MLKDDICFVLGCHVDVLTGKTLDHFSVLCKKSYANDIQDSNKAKAEKSAIQLSRLICG